MKTSKKKQQETGQAAKSVMDYMSFDTASDGRYVMAAYKYRVQTPDQVKLRILWENVQSLIEATFGKSDQNKEILTRYKLEWSAAEKEECRVLAKAVKPKRR